MAWFKVDDGLHSSRKLLSIPKRTRWAAVGVWTVAGAWSADQLTDGFIPDYMLNEWGTPPAAPEALVEAGLWERTQDGYVFHNWHEYQPRKEDVDAERAASRERMRDLRARRKGPKPRNDGEEEGVFERTAQNGSENVRNPDPTRPDPTHTEAKASVPRKRASRIPEDFAVTQEMIQWAQEKTPNVDGRLATEKFINYWTAKSGKDATKLDWVATWRNWMLSDQEKNAGKGDLHLTTSERRMKTNLERGQQWQPTIVAEDVFARKAIGA